MKEYNESLPDRSTSLTLIIDPSDQSTAVIRNVITSIASTFNYQLIGAENVIQFREVPVTSSSIRTVEFYVPEITAALIMTNGIIALSSTTS